ncbi:MAG: cytochrome c biogenesis protein ResB [Deltaproteobacteria bacterium]|nr:cytochrome c biogenesis protein ResB [Deltaproteobacteria bacterium]
MIDKLNIIYRALGSAKLAIFLFFSLAVTSIMGTVVPQGLSPEQYQSLYSPQVYSLLDIFDIFDMFHSWWFTALLALLAVNLTVCTTIQLRRIFRVYLFPKSKIDDSVFQSAHFSKSFQSHKDLSEIKEQSEIILKTLIGRPSSLSTGDGSYLFAEKGKYSRLGVIFIHLSVLFILAGGLIAALWGFDGTMRIVEGETSNLVYLSGGNRAMSLGFDVRCDNFTVDFYAGGVPKEYRSEITILERGQEQLSDSIRVNHPLQYRGLKFYQSGYGIAPKSYTQINVKNKKTDVETVLKMKVMEKHQIPGSDIQLAIGEFKSDYQGQGPAVLGVLFERGKPHEMFWIFPEGAENVSVMGDFIFTLKDFKRYYYTGLRVAKNPGMPLVWEGFLLVLIGFILNLFFAHERVWVKIRENPEGTEIKIAASSSKRRDLFEKKINTLSGKLGLE